MKCPTCDNKKWVWGQEDGKRAKVECLCQQGWHVRTHIINPNGRKNDIKMVAALYYKNDEMHRLRGKRGEIILQEQADVYNQQGRIPTINFNKCRADVTETEARKWK